MMPFNRNIPHTEHTREITSFEEPLPDYKWTECEIRTEVWVKVLTEV